MINNTTNYYCYHDINESNDYNSNNDSNNINSNSNNNRDNNNTFPYLEVFH